uniref:GRIP domain-containing protein n=1 Tax=Rhabditophanes sp. KR3021 TaxID=114890 RepID=A0AC35U3C8_9BILA
MKDVQQISPDSSSSSKDSGLNSRHNDCQTPLRSFHTQNIGASSTPLPCIVSPNQHSMTQRLLQDESKILSDKEGSFVSEDSTKENNIQRRPNNAATNTTRFLKAMRTSDLKDVFAESDTLFAKPNNENHQICNKKVADLQNENKNLETKIRELEKTVDKLLQDESAKEMKISVLETNKATLAEVSKQATINEEELKTIRNNYAQSKDEVVNLKTRLKSMETFKQQKEKEINDLKDSLLSLQKDAGNNSMEDPSKKKLVALQKKFEEAKVLISKLEEERNMFNDENQDLKKNLENKEIVIEKLKSEGDVWREECSDTKNKLTTIEKKYFAEKKSKDISGYMAKQAADEKQIRSLLEERKVLQDKLDKEMADRKNQSAAGDVTNGFFGTSGNASIFNNYHETVNKFKISVEQVKDALHGIDKFKSNFGGTKQKIIENTVAKYDDVMINKMSQLTMALTIMKNLCKILKDDVHILKLENTELIEFKKETIDEMLKIGEACKIRFGNDSDPRHFWNLISKYINQTKEETTQISNGVRTLREKEVFPNPKRQIFGKNDIMSPIRETAVSTPQSLSNETFTKMMEAYEQAMSDLSSRDGDIKGLKHVIKINESNATKDIQQANDTIKVIKLEVATKENLLKEMHERLIIVMKNEKKAKCIVKKLSECMINHFNLHHKNMEVGQSAYQFYSIVKHATNLLGKKK